MLCSLGFGYVWIYQFVGDKKLFILEVKKRLIDISNQEWRSHVNTHFPEYLNYHPDLFIAPYLTYIKSYRVRRALALLRTFSLPIKNNQLRINIVNDNICDTCNGKFAQNEFHVLFRCTALTDLRRKHLPEFTNHDHTPLSVNDLHNILCCQDEHLTLRMSYFLKNALL